MNMTPIANTRSRAELMQDITSIYADIRELKRHAKNWKHDDNKRGMATIKRLTDQALALQDELKCRGL